MIKKILINATNLNEGGGVQVAASFLNDLMKLDISNDLEISVFVSSIVDKNLHINLLNKSVFHEYKVIKPREINFLNSYKLNNFDLVFTVFGPFYIPLYKNKHICGFAQPWVIYKNNEVLKKINFIYKYYIITKYKIISFIFKRSNILIVETNNVKNKLKELGYKNKIIVVDNSVSSIFFKKSEWKEVKIPIIKEGMIKVGVVSGGYIHKNLNFIVELENKLNVIFPGKFHFIFTLKKDIYEKLIRHKNCYSTSNIGPIKIQECPSFYDQMDAVMLPSFLECFSITPYESMLMKKVIFLSDRDFFRKICLDHAQYFDPTNVDDAINILKSWFFSKSEIEKKTFLENAHIFVKDKNSSINKTIQYLKIINAEDI